MAADLGKAYVQIVPSAQGISGKISGLLGGETAAAGKAAGTSLGSSLVSAMGGVLAAAGIGSMVKKSLEAGGALQQSFGGLETIYGEAADAAKKYSDEAVKAGISSNSYAEQAVSFGAALKQAYSGDTMKAMEAANTAILDMADNSAKMGTDINAVQTAYQGFAKQNYTMLDNLKLGYGGTKTEMERLLKDAEKLSGVKYDIDNLGDVYDAIHVIQTDLGLTGVAAKEASETFSGSFEAMKAAGENLIGNLALGNDISPYLSTLMETVGNFLQNNMIPMVGNILQSLPQVISEGLIPALNGAVDMAIAGLNFAADNASGIVSKGMELVTTLVFAIIEAAPKLLEAAAQCAMAFGQALISYDWMSLGSELMTAIQGMFPTESATTVMQPILDGITAALPGLLEKGVEIITNLANGIMSALPGMISTAGQIVTSLGTFLMDNAPTILNAGADLLLNLVNGIIDNLPEIAHSAIEVVMNMVQTLAENYPAIIQAGFDLIIKLVSGLSQAYPELVSAVLEICADLVTQFLSVDWVGLGADIVNGIIKGIVDLGDAFVNAILTMCSGALDAVKKFFGIESPSKVFANEVGRYIPEGIALGIEKNADVVTDAMKDLSAETLTAAGRLNVATAYEFNDNQNETAAILARMDAMLNLMSRYFPEMAETDVNMSSINRYLGAALS
jgi:phage-related protein